MGKVITNNEIEIMEIDDRIHELNRVIPFCKTRAEALDIQNDILELEERKEELELIESEVCPECGSYEQDDEDDDLTCHHEYHSYELDKWLELNRPSDES